MTSDIEEQLMAGMRDEVAGLRLTTDIVGVAARRHHHRTLVQRTLYAAGVVGLAGAIAATFAIGVAGQSGGPGGAGGDQPPVVVAESANLQLVAAVTASENISYQVKLTRGTEKEPASLSTTKGAFDPAAATGYLDSTSPGADVVYTERLIDGVRYVGSSGSKAWKQYPGKHDRLAYDHNLNGAVGASADPEQLFAALREAKAVITKSGKNTFHFESNRPYDNQWATGTVTLTGDVTLDADNRIGKVAYTLTDKGQMKPGVKGGLAYDSTQLFTLELSNYGVPVKVEKPTNVVVVK